MEPTKQDDLPQTMDPRSVTLAIPDSGALVTEQGTIVARAFALVITTDEEYTAACAEIGAWAKFKGRVEAFFEDDTKRAYDLWKSLTGKRKTILDPVDQAMRIGSDKVTKYEQEKARVAAEAQRVREEAARKMENEQKLAEAIALQEAGHADAAEAVLDEPVNVPVMSAPAVPVVAGKQSRTYYKAKVVDLPALLKHILAHPEDQGLVEVSQAMLNKRAEYQKDNFKLAGCVLDKQTGQAWAKK